MVSCLTSVFKAIVGLLVKKGRYATAEKLRQLRRYCRSKAARRDCVRESFKPMENTKLRGTEQNK